MGEPWKNRIVATGDESPDQLLANPANWRVHPKAQQDALASVLDEVGWVQRVIVNKTTSHVVDGHLRVALALSREEPTIPVSYVELSAAEEQMVLATFDPLAAMAATDKDKLADLLRQAEINDAGLREALNNTAGIIEEPTSGNTDPDDVPAERSTDIQRGDLFALGDHRLLCGDSTNADDVARVMDGVTVPLVHADPPYGMGKEKDGVVNDNLYREKLDAFQMAWWSAVRPSLKDNASAYIWGTAEDLWRLWYVGGLAGSERLTVRNELILNKISGMGMNSELHHQYATATERCLFLMLGRLFIGNQNVEDYWEGYEPLRSSLCLEVEKAGWTKAEVNRITNTHMAGHWLTKCQFEIIGKENYGKLQVAANGNAFLLSYFDFVAQFPRLRDNGNRRQRHWKKRMRPLFNNTHDNMTDVWEFPRVTGEDRHGHATPKPVGMVARAIQSSTAEDGAVVEPFAGSGTTIIAAEQLGRKCYAIEIEPSYCQVTIDRWEAFTGKTAKKVNHERSKTKTNRHQTARRKPRETTDQS